VKKSHRAAPSRKSVEGSTTQSEQEEIARLNALESGALAGKETLESGESAQSFFMVVFGSCLVKVCVNYRSMRYSRGFQISATRRKPMVTNDNDQVKTYIDKRKRIASIEEEIAKAQAAKAPRSKIMELQNLIDDIIQEGRATPPGSRLKNKAKKLIVLEMRRMELRSELRAVEKHIKELLNEELSSGS
jgi:hypothetical protein